MGPRASPEKGTTMARIARVENCPWGRSLGAVLNEKKKEIWFLKDRSVDG